MKTEMIYEESFMYKHRYYVETIVNSLLYHGVFPEKMQFSGCEHCFSFRVDITLGGFEYTIETHLNYKDPTKELKQSIALFLEKVNGKDKA